MPLTQFRCPDRVRISTIDCLSACRMASRCLTCATLKVIAEERVWDGIPHVTQLLNGTMLEFLKITKDYCISPKDRAFALLGSSHHKLLESMPAYSSYWEELKESGMLSELPLNNGWMQGTLDMLELDNGKMVLTDAKCWGSNRLVRDKPSGVDFDPSRTPVDLNEVTLQLNAYRIMLEQQYEWKVDRLQVQCTVRDGGLSVAVKRGVKENMYLLPVPRLPDTMVLSYFLAKTQALKNALDNPSSVDICTADERWHDSRCKSYCDVSAFCPYGKRFV